MKRLFLAALLLVLGHGSALAAIASIGSLLTANNGSAGTTWAPVTSATLEVGNIAVCVIGSDETGSGTTDGDNSQHNNPTDAAGNTWNFLFEMDNMQTSTAADGAVVSAWYTQATTQLNSGAAITFSFSASTTRKAATCWEFSVAGGSTVVRNPNGSAVANDGVDPTSLATSAGAGEHLFVRGTACENNSTAWTSDTDYTSFTHTSSTSNSGTAATSIGVRSEFRIATESPSLTSDPTYVAADCASRIQPIDEVLAAGGSSGLWGGWW